MARLRANDYQDKRQALRQASAALFAERGYDGASVTDIAEAAGVSKALVYHYYANKEDVLVDIIESHLKDLLDAVKAVTQDSLSPEAYLTALISALLEAYRDADHEHKIQINELARLPAERQRGLVAMERQLVAVFALALSAANPALQGQPHLLKPLTMSLFGILNWHYMWWRADGALSRDSYAELVTRLIVDGSRAWRAAPKRSLAPISV